MVYYGIESIAKERGMKVTKYKGFIAVSIRPVPMFLWYVANYRRQLYSHRKISSTKYLRLRQRRKARELMKGE